MLIGDLDRQEEMSNPAIEQELNEQILTTYAPYLGAHCAATQLGHARPTSRGKLRAALPHGSDPFFKRLDICLQVARRRERFVDRQGLVMPALPL